MSNKSVPAVYRTIIDDVVHHVRPEFEQIGVEEAVLQELLRLWELKLAQSRVADFSTDERMGPVAKQFPPLTPEQVALHQQLLQQQQQVASSKPQGNVKKENGDDKAGAKGDDEDAINSDLDSSEDELDEDAEAAAGGDDQGGDIVIALYEKVQRVKNKWKVTLKDGLISVNGKEYVFSKCNGLSTTTWEDQDSCSSLCLLPRGARPGTMASSDSVRPSAAVEDEEEGEIVETPVVPEPKARQPLKITINSTSKSKSVDAKSNASGSTSTEPAPSTTGRKGGLAVRELSRANMLLNGPPKTFAANKKNPLVASAPSHPEPRPSLEIRGQAKRATSDSDRARDPVEEAADAAPVIDEPAKTEKQDSLPTETIAPASLERSVEAELVSSEPASAPVPATEDEKPRFRKRTKAQPRASVADTTTVPAAAAEDLEALEQMKVDSTPKSLQAKPLYHSPPKNSNEKPRPAPAERANYPQHGSRQDYDRQDYSNGTRDEPRRAPPKREEEQRRSRQDDRGWWDERDDRGPRRDDRDNRHYDRRSDRSHGPRYSNQDRDARYPDDHRRPAYQDDSRFTSSRNDPYNHTNYSHHQPDHQLHRSSYAQDRSPASHRRRSRSRSRSRSPRNPRRRRSSHEYHRDPDDALPYRVEVEAPIPSKRRRRSDSGQPRRAPSRTPPSDIEGSGRSLSPPPPQKSLMSPRTKKRSEQAIAEGRGYREDRPRDEDADSSRRAEPLRASVTGGSKAAPLPPRSTLALPHKPTAPQGIHSIAHPSDQTRRTQDAPQYSGSEQRHNPLNGDAQQERQYDAGTPPLQNRHVQRPAHESGPPRPAYGSAARLDPGLDSNGQSHASRPRGLQNGDARYPAPPPAPFHKEAAPTDPPVGSEPVSGAGGRLTPIQVARSTRNESYAGVRTESGLNELWLGVQPRGPVAETSDADPSAQVDLDETHSFFGASHIDEYTLQQKLGEGTFGVVYKGIRGKENEVVSAEEREVEKQNWHRGLRVKKGDVVALKQIIFHNEGDGLPITSVREIRILKQLDHPNVVPVVDMALDPGDSSKFQVGRTFMVFPYMDHDLAGLLENPQVKLDIGEIKQYSKQLLEGTAYLHRNGILHRDMKAANLLINNQGTLMIADFGLARSMEPVEAGRDYTSCVVTRWYRPPELLLGERKYHYPVDMWGVGCILLEMFERRPVFPGNSDLHQAQLIFRACGGPTDESMPGWRSLPGVEGIDKAQQQWEQGPRRIRADASRYDTAEFADLIDRILTLDPKRRLTASKALDHDWFWSEPFPTEPSRMREFMSSHEYDRRKIKEAQHAAFGQVLPPAPMVQHVPQPMPPMGYNGNMPPGPPHGMQYPPIGPYNAPPPAPPMQYNHSNGGYPNGHGGPRNMRPPHGHMPPQQNGYYGQPPPMNQHQPYYPQPPPQMPPQYADLDYGRDPRQNSGPSGPSWAEKNSINSAGGEPPKAKVNLKARLAAMKK
ncbi:uncharacterized protein JCM15063_001924 [Sporobolomyces koalae]|uniref:uncharacterized protein n=1 Tax=Sporobolomyces koalae TaxID=500713 RepID=UPI00317E216F